METEATALPELLKAFMWIQGQWPTIVNFLAQGIAFATVIVKITPTLKDDNYFLPIVKFLGKFIALNTNSPTARPS